MTEFIGSRISLISKRDIRYVGTLHEISSENSTVALENVTSYGTEGRRPDEEVPPNLDNTYEYIVFRGSDVKDLRIEEGPKEAKKPPQMPDDPAILGSTRKPQAVGTSTVSQPISSGPQPTAPGEQSASESQGVPSSGSSARQQAPQFPQQPYPYPFGPPHQRFGPPGPGGFNPGASPYGFQSMPYGPPPGWFPPQGFPQQMTPHHQFLPPGQLPVGPPGQLRPHMADPSSPLNDGGATAETSTTKGLGTGIQPKPVATVRLPSSSNTPAPLQPLQSAPSAKSDVSTVAAAATSVETKPENNYVDKSSVKAQKLIPAIPLSPLPKTVRPTNEAGKNATPGSENKGPLSATVSHEDANRDARAAVAAAMAKLPAGEKKQADGGGALDSVTRAISELKTNDATRNRGNRGNRGVPRGGRESGRRIEVPKTDFDFETANAKFNKHDLVKEAIATGSPVENPGYANGDIIADGQDPISKTNDPGVSIPVGVSYNRTSSFFDDISSEIKDRAEGKEAGQRMGGREYRNEERQKNLETFGQGSVDNGYRYGRGRGRGRGFSRGRGRGYGAGRNNNRGRQPYAAVEG